MATVELKKIVKHYPGNPEPTVRGIDLTIADREFLVLVGPSGCGKSTVLRMIAGLEDITGGEMLIGERKVNDLLPKDRNIAMVFQNYALFPHLSVRDNIIFGMKVRGASKDEMDKAVEMASSILGLDELLERKPGELSGGQRQRVAVGRAIVRKPVVFLFDEPLSNLDAKLRAQMRAEIIKLHRQLKTTMVYVTHDQIEAMTMSDRIVVFSDGHIQQLGTPKELYDKPVSRFVAGFIGSPPMNFIEGDVSGEDDALEFQSAANGGVAVALGEDAASMLPEGDDKAVTPGVRPQDLHLAGTAPAEVTASKPFSARVELVEYFGSESCVTATAGDDKLMLVVKARGLQPGDEVEVVADLDRLHFFPPEG